MGAELGGASAVDALDRGHVVVVAAVADLDVALAGDDAVRRVEPDPDRLAAAGAARQEDLEPGVRVDLDRVVAAVARGREQVAGDIARGDAAATQQDQREVDEVLADAGADVEQVGDRRADVGDPAAVGEAIRDQLAEMERRAQRRRRVREVVELLERARRRLGDAREQVLAGGLEVGRRAELLPERVGRGGGFGGDDAGTDVDHQRAVRLGNPELDDLRAEVIAVAPEPRLRIDPHVELVAALVGGRRGTDTQGVEVVADGSRVLVLGGVVDREVHQAVIMRSAGATPPK